MSISPDRMIRILYKSHTHIFGFLPTIVLISINNPFFLIPFLKLLFAHNCFHHLPIWIQMATSIILPKIIYQFHSRINLSFVGLFIVYMIGIAKKKIHNFQIHYMVNFCPIWIIDFKVLDQFFKIGVRFENPIDDCSNNSSSF